MMKNIIRAIALAGIACLTLLLVACSPATTIRTETPDWYNVATGQTQCIAVSIAYGYHAYTCDWRTFTHTVQKTDASTIPGEIILIDGKETYCITPSASHGHRTIECDWEGYTIK